LRVASEQADGKAYAVKKANEALSCNDGFTMGPRAGITFAADKRWALSKLFLNCETHVSILHSQSDSNINDPRLADAPAIQSSEVRSPSQKQIGEKQWDAEPADPPSASPTPLRGQVETNQPITGNEAEAEKAFQEVIARRSSATGFGSADLAAQRAAFDLGWQGYLQHGRQQATPEVTFENVEPELAQLWRLKEALQPQRLPWEEAKDTARDAWDRVRDALTGS